MKVKSESEVAQSCLTLSDPMNCSLPGSSVHGIFQARVLEWGALACSFKNSQGGKWVWLKKDMKNSYEDGNILPLDYIKVNMLEMICCYPFAMLP